jgi:hypothetical protein
MLMPSGRWQRYRLPRRRRDRGYRQRISWAGAAAALRGFDEPVRLFEVRWRD